MKKFLLSASAPEEVSRWYFYAVIGIMVAEISEGWDVGLWWVLSPLAWLFTILCVLWGVLGALVEWAMEDW